MDRLTLVLSTYYQQHGRDPVGEDVRISELHPHHENEEPSRRHLTFGPAWAEIKPGTVDSPGYYVVSNLAKLDTPPTPLRPQRTDEEEASTVFVGTDEFAVSVRPGMVAVFEAFTNGNRPIYAKTGGGTVPVRVTVYPRR